MECFGNAVRDVIYHLPAQMGDEVRSGQSGDNYSGRGNGKCKTSQAGRSLVQGTEK